jgi:hypothetical protein
MGSVTAKWFQSPVGSGREAVLLEQIRSSVRHNSVASLSELDLAVARRGFRLRPVLAQSHGARPRFGISADRVWGLWLVVAADHRIWFDYHDFGVDRRCVIE